MILNRPLPTPKKHRRRAKGNGWFWFRPQGVPKRARVRLRFALLPTRISDTEIVWLQHYYQFYPRWAYSPDPYKKALTIFGLKMKSYSPVDPYYRGMK